MDPDAVHPHVRLPLSAIVVEPELQDLLLAVSTLSAAGFHVTVAANFTKARALLSSRRPSLLMTEIQLGDYNGLHLVLHGKAVRPDMAAIVTAHRSDRVLQAETERMGATFVLKPTEQSELLAAVARTFLRAPGETTAITGPFERRRAERRVRHDTAPARVERRHGERRWGLAPLREPTENR